ncbi:hypothetical protein FEP83_03392 [Burkholderia multivorans]|nr:hypothetical protein [Burkholderia multivorans]
MRIEAVHQPAEHDRTERTADLKHRGHARGGLQRRAGRAQQRRQPARQQVDHEQTHEEREPQQQRTAQQIGPEQPAERRRRRLAARRDERRVREMRIRRDAAQQRRDPLARRAAVHQIAHRFRQPPCEHRQQQQRRDTADDEHRAPAVAFDQRCGDEPAERRADREAAEHRRHEQRAASCRTVFGRQRDRVRHCTAKPEPRHEAPRDQFRDTARTRRRGARDAEACDAGEQQPLAPEPVAERPERQRAGHQPGEPRAEHRRELRGRQLPFRPNHGRDESDRRGVEPVDRDDEKAQHDDRNLKRRHASPVDPFADVDGQRGIHDDVSSRNARGSAGARARRARYATGFRQSSARHPCSHSSAS